MSRGKAAHFEPDDSLARRTLAADHESCFFINDNNALVVFCPTIVTVRTAAIPRDPDPRQIRPHRPR